MVIQRIAPIWAYANVLELQFDAMKKRHTFFHGFRFFKVASLLCGQIHTIVNVWSDFSKYIMIRLVMG